MRQFYSSVLERRKTFTDTIETPPYEAAWASEAIFFIRVEAISEGAEVELGVQISADGMHWVDDGPVTGALTEVGDFCIKASHFGGWLRLSGAVRSPDSSVPNVMLTIHLALKS